MGKFFLGAAVAVAGLYVLGRLARVAKKPCKCHETAAAAPAAASGVVPPAPEPVQ